jgi:hypothetical protein
LRFPMWHLENRGQLIKQLQFANCLFIPEIELPAPTVRVIA